MHWLDIPIGQKEDGVGEMAKVGKEKEAQKKRENQSLKQATHRMRKTGK